jgi:hypothetical protein
LIFQLIVYQVFLRRNKKDLWRHRIRKTHESLYMGLKLTSTRALYYPLMFLIRRLLYVLIAIS